MKVGYARVSTATQNPAHQVDALTRDGVATEDIYVDVASGAKASRPQLDVMLRVVRAGDVIVITRLDRLGRSVLHLVNLAAGLRERGVQLRVLEQGIDTTTIEGRAMFGMLSVLAELQRELIAANVQDGLAAARARGRVGGRRPKLTQAQALIAQELYDARKKTVTEIAAIFGVNRTTLYNYLDRGTPQVSETVQDRDPKGLRERALPADVLRYLTKDIKLTDTELGRVMGLPGTKVRAVVLDGRTLARKVGRLNDLRLVVSVLVNAGVTSSDVARFLRVDGVGPGDTPLALLRADAHPDVQPHQLELVLRAARSFAATEARAA